MFAVHGNPHGRATTPPRQPPALTERKPLCPAISEIYPKRTALATQWAITKRQWAPLQQDKRGQRQKEEYGGGRGEFCCVCSSQPSAPCGGCCSATEATGGVFGVCGDPCSRPKTNQTLEEHWYFKLVHPRGALEGKGFRSTKLVLDRVFISIFVKTALITTRGCYSTDFPTQSTWCSKYLSYNLSTNIFISTVWSIL